MMAPIAGAAIERMLRDSPRSAFPSWRRSSLTASRTIPVVAGREKAAAMPNTACSKPTFQTLAVPANSSTAVTTCAEPLTRSHPIRITRRGSRSAKTPPSRRKITIGISRASSTMPRSVAPPKSSTAKASATIAMPEPSVDTVTDAR